MNEIDYLELQAIYLENMPYKPDLQLFKRHLITNDELNEWQNAVDHWSLHKGKL